MTLTSSNAKDIVRLGANIEITGNAHYNSSIVKDIIRIAIKAGGDVTIQAGGYTSSSLKDFARLGKDKVTIKI